MPRKVPAPPPPELLDRIRGEIAASGFLRDLTTWADRQCGKLLSIENRIEPHKATELVNAAVVDTCDGVRRWDPAARTLRRHLEQTINSRLWHECERSRRRRFIVLDTASVDDSQDATGGAAIHVEVSELREDPRTRPDGQLAQREVRARVFEVLRQRAARDAELLALVDAYEAGHSRQSDAEARVGLSGQAFQNLVRRFKTIRGHIPDELRDAAQEALVRDGGAPLAGCTRGDARSRALLDPLVRSPAHAHAQADSDEEPERSGDGSDSGDGFECQVG